jgi:hypothetical protein
LCSCAAFCAGQQLIFQGMTATYSGNGTMSLGTPFADFMYTLVISGSTNASGGTGTLTIKPKNANVRNDVFIDTIYSALPLNVNITFPPGKTKTCYLRNLYVNGPCNTLKIIGGDLGACDAEDGRVIVSGNLGTVQVGGKKFNVPDTTLTEWWGGNIWADITAYGTVNKIYTSGGDMYYDQHGGILGMITAYGDMNMLAVNGTAVKTNRADKTTNVMFGGTMNAEVNNVGYKIKQLNAKGGTIMGGAINCLQLGKVNIVGQKSTNPPRRLPPAMQGMFRVYLTAKDNGGDGKDCVINNLTIQNGSLRDCLFANKGNIKGVKVNGETINGMGIISNVVMRAGFVGDLSVSNTEPSIAADNYSTNVYGGNTVTMPFIVTQADPGERLTTRIHFRDYAINALISNDAGQVFYGTNRWHLDSTPATGYFVWATSTKFLGTTSNVTLRVYDNGIPSKDDLLVFVINVSTTLTQPQIVLSPPDNPRTYVVGSGYLEWITSITEPYLQPSITYSIDTYSSNAFGMSILDLGNKQTLFHANVIPPVGTYSNVIFTASNGAFSSQQSITVIITTNVLATLATTLPQPHVTVPINTTVDFDVLLHNAAAECTLRPRSLPPGATCDLHAAGARVVWVPRHSDVGTHQLIFQARDTRMPWYAPCVTATVTVVASLRAAAPPAAPAPPVRLGWEGSFNGDFTSLNCVGSVYDSMFVSSAADQTPNDWASAIYFGKLGSLNIKGVVQSNTFVSTKKIGIAKADTFDFMHNFVWINGTRATDKSQE